MKKSTRFAVLGSVVAALGTGVVIAAAPASAADLQPANVRVHSNVNVRGDSFDSICAHTTTQRAAVDPFDTATIAMLPDPVSLPCDNRAVMVEATATYQIDGSIKVHLTVSSVDRRFDTPVEADVVVFPAPVGESPDLVAVDLQLENEDPLNSRPSAFGHFAVSARTIAPAG